MEIIQILLLIMFSALMYGIATVISENFEQHTTVAYFMAGVIFAAVGMAYTKTNDA